MSPANRFLSNLVSNFFTYNCQKSAAALTYITLFAIVPLMTVMYSIFSVIPVFNGVAEQLQKLIFSHFVPETGQEVQVYLSNFSSQARSLTGFGVGMLVVTSYLMLINIEKTFNAIWGVQKGRRGLSSFLLYWAILSIGPLLLGAGLAMTTYLLSLKLFMSEIDTIGVTNALLQVLPILLTSTAFSLLFVAVPNCRVPIKFGIIGGVLTALCFEALKNVFGLLVSNSSLQLVYGAFAVVPLFLLWVNLAWTVILTGAILVRTLAERNFLLDRAGQCDMLTALNCLCLFHERYKIGQAVSDSDCYRLGLNIMTWQQLKAKFERFQWITTTSSGNYVLSHDLRRVSLWDLSGLLEMKINSLALKVDTESVYPWLESYLGCKEQAGSGVKQAFTMSIEELFNHNNTPKNTTKL